MTSKATYNPYELLTDDLVEKALLKEFGDNVRLESYKVVDFTKKGDNFASSVTSIQVIYDLDGTKGQQSYIVKLTHNHEGPEFIVQMFRYLYLREAIVLGTMRDSMNELLKDLNQPMMRSPRCLSWCNDPKKEVLLSQDLRNDGFVMADKMKGMDFKHARFVMEELGRFHATSILYEKQLGVLVEKIYPPFDDPLFTPNNPNVTYFSQMISTQAQVSIDILNWVRKSDDVNRWWDNIKPFCSELWIRNNEATEKFNVLAHGDCWNNNMLFRYDQNGEPVDFRLVDFQMTRRSSPACDLVYFFYSSLTGEIRQKYKKRLLVEYYLAFAKILLLAHQPIPFTFAELQEEFQTRIIYGFASSMLLLPTTLVKPEDALTMGEMLDQTSQVAIEKRKRFFKFAQNHPDLKTRFLSMFDEMAELGIFERRKTIYNPYKLLNEKLVEEALKNDVGEHAILQAFQTQNFTNKGDNYTSSVISIKVHYEEEDDEKKTTKQKIYVVKLNPQRDMGPMNKFFEVGYKKESLILKTITVGMSEELIKLDLPELKVPKAFSFCSEDTKQVLIMNNLKLEGFVMFDRKKEVNVEHTLLVMEELGRFHASSLLYEDILKRPIHEEFQEHFNEDWLAADDPGIIMFNRMLGIQLDTSIDILTDQTGYEKVIDWINKLKDSAASIFKPSLNMDNKKFNVFSHCDCWTNNILFKYDADGKPIDIRIVDLQEARPLSVACDLNYFFYSSTSGKVRQKHKNQFLVQYYLSFSEVLLLAKKTVPFTFEELKMEFKTYMPYGCITGMFLLPLVIVDDDDSLPVDGLNEEKLAETLQNHRQRFRKLAFGKKDFVQRFLSMFDEMIQEGIIV